MNTGIKAVIFDFDGLILDTEKIESDSFERVLQEYGKEPQYNKYGLVHDTIGGGKDHYPRFIEKYGLTEDIETIKNKKRVFFEKIVKEERLEPMLGFFQLLEMLRKNKYFIALASNRNEESISTILNMFGVEESFIVIVGPSNERRHKPEPDIYIDTAKKLGINPKECLVLEDSAMGVLAARSAGMKVIAVPNQYTRTDDFAQADLVVESLSSVTREMLENI